MGLLICVSQENVRRRDVAPPRLTLRVYLTLMGRKLHVAKMYQDTPWQPYAVRRDGVSRLYGLHYFPSTENANSTFPGRPPQMP